LKISVIITCFNRKDYTVNCIKKLNNTNMSIDFEFIVTDDLSSDGTREALEELKSYIDIKLPESKGGLYWNGGMRNSLDVALHCSDADYIMLVNDDVDFEEGVIEKIFKDNLVNENTALVGTVASKSGELSYGGVHFLSKKFVKYDIMDIDDERECDTFNANLVILPMEMAKKLGNLDEHYTHSLGDFDYGFRVKKAGYKIVKTPYYVGTCNDNDIKGTWRDTSLSRKERLRLKESPKGLKFSDWWHFVNKNFGFFSAVYHSLTPYLRILINK